MISQSDFANWQLDPVTIAFRQACLERVEDSKEILSVSAGIDSDADNYLRGFIAAYNEIRQFRIEDEDND